MELSSHRTDCHEIWYLRSVYKSVDKIWVSLNLTIHFTSRPTYIHISGSSENEKHCGQTCIKNQNTHLFSVIFFRKIVPFMQNVGGKRTQCVSTYNTGYSNAPQCYFTSTLGVFLKTWFSKASYVHINTLYDKSVSKKRAVTDSLQLGVSAGNQHLTNSHSP